MDPNNIAHTKSTEYKMLAVKPRETNPKLCWQWKVCTLYSVQWYTHPVAGTSKYGLTTQDTHPLHSTEDDEGK